MDKYSTMTTEQLAAIDAIRNKGAFVEANTACEGCPATDAKLYRATQAAGPDFEVRFCDECAASYQGADMGASGCDAQGTLTLVQPLITVEHSTGIAVVDAIRSLLTHVERVIDEHPVLTRKRAPGAVQAPPSEAEMCIGRNGCRVQIAVRHGTARGRGSRQMHQIWGEGDTPRAAVESLVDRLPHWTEALS